MKRLIILLAALAAVPAYAQYTTPLDAKVLGMGGVAMTAVGNSHPIYSNPAMGLFSQTPTQVSSSYMGQKNADSYTLTGSYLFNFNNLALAGWQQSFLRDNGNLLALDLGYARRIGGKWAVGAALRYMREKYDHPDGYMYRNNNALVLDLTAAYSLPLNNLGRYSTLRAGAKLSNLGGYFDKPAPCYKLPITFQAGAALDTYISDSHEVTVGVDLGYCFTPPLARGFGMSVGAEYNLMQLVQFRAGYHYGDHRYFEPSYGSLGAGVRFLHLRLDFAYLFAGKDTRLHNAYSFSFGFDF